MKKETKAELREGCGEAALEIVLSLVLLAIGAGVLALFGVSVDAEWLDEDLLMLIGIGAVLLVGGAVFGVFRIIKKKKITAKNAENNKTKEINTKENNHV